MQSTAAKYSFRNAALQSSKTGGEGLLLISNLFGSFVGLALRGSFKPGHIAVELVQSYGSSNATSDRRRDIASQRVSAASLIPAA